MVIIHNLSHSDATISFEAIPKSRIEILIAAYCLYHEASRVVITDSANPMGSVEGICGTEELAGRLKRFYDPIIRIKF